MKKVKEVEVMESLVSFEYPKKHDFKLKYLAHYGFIRSLCIRGQKERILEFSKSLKDRYENFVQIGIGGSALPLEASLRFLDKKGVMERFLSLDNIDPCRIERVLSLDIDKTFFHVVSKSGSTIEILAEFFVLKERLKPDQIAFTTSEKGFLYELGMKEGIELFFIPDEVGGRYSVFSPVGLIGLAFFGFNIDTFIEGAKTAVRAYRNGWDFPNDFVNFAIGAYQDNKNILVMFAYKDYLYGIIDWFRQLWAESLGKDSKGQTPINALGVTDQHSQLQLYQDGPKDKAIVFLDAPAVCDFEIKDDYGFGYLKGKSLSQIMEIEKNSTMRALKESGADVAHLKLTKDDEFSLGALLMGLMIATAKAGKVLGVDPFNQPGVELGKRYTKEALKNG
ncbi:phosphoglucose isomerase [Hippea maritima]|uniref:Glucose-6-phosphate isomerase n=1 Tax=Hippea maritima (strain ATCC 700847 / DSM 10411 / MH2) TaxID=760142 RepID=F2LWM3_HIPMA|nr:phosphoglucose isomerase [Hippea maritima]AEA34132.1 phosphoglucose isomerase (PGI) [Hippea maritima DSM 10411]